MARSGSGRPEGTAPDAFESAGWLRASPGARVALQREGTMPEHMGADETQNPGARPGAELRGARLRQALTNVEAFGDTILHTPLRPYQAEVARAILASVA